MRGFTVAALALAGLLFAWTPAAERIDLLLLDVRIAFLAKYAPRPAPDDILIVGIDEADLARIPEPWGVWHEPLAKVLLKIAATEPRAIGLDVMLPDRSYDGLRAGLDRMLMTGLAAAREKSSLVAVVNIDPRTGTAKLIHTPFLAVLTESRLGVGLFGRDADGVVRRFSIAIPTDEGSFPTLAGRLCRSLAKGCRDGLIDFAFGKAFRYVPFREVLESQDSAWLEKLFKGRIVMIGETQRLTGRVDVPVNMAGWEPGGRSSPGVVVHAASLRTALHGSPPEDTGKPLLLLTVSLAALLVFMRDWRMAALSAFLGAIAWFAVATWALRGGWVVDIAPALFTLMLAAGAVGARAWRAPKV